MVFVHTILRELLLINYLEIRHAGWCKNWKASFVEGQVWSTRSWDRSWQRNRLVSRIGRLRIMKWPPPGPGTILRKSKKGYLRDVKYVRLIFFLKSYLRLTLGLWCTWDTTKGDWNSQTWLVWARYFANWWVLQIKKNWWSACMGSADYAYDADCL